MKAMLIMILSKLKYFAAMGVVLLTPIHAALIAIGFLVGVDFILGVYASYKNDVKISSKKMAQSIFKMLTYQLLIVASFITMTYMMPFFPLVKLTLAFIGITEFLSIGENFQKITGLEFVKYIKNALIKYTKKHSDSDGEVIKQKGPKK